MAVGDLLRITFENAATEEAVEVDVVEPGGPRRLWFNIASARALGKLNVFDSERPCLRLCSGHSVSSRLSESDRP